MAQDFAKQIIKQKELSRRKKLWIGGELDYSKPENMYNNSSGEPHTNDKKTAKEPMEYMADGGKVSPWEVITTFDMGERAKKQAALNKQRDEKTSKFADGGEAKEKNPDFKAYAEAHPNEQKHKFSFPGMKDGGEVSPKDLQALTIIKKLFAGGPVGESNFEVTGADDQEDPDLGQGGYGVGDSNYHPSGAGLEKEYFADGGEVEEDPAMGTDKQEFAKHLKKKMRGY